MAKSFDRDSIGLIVFLVIELMFLIDIIVTFFVEFKSEEKLYPTRDLLKIGERYIKT